MKKLKIFFLTLSLMFYSVAFSDAAGVNSIQCVEACLETHCEKFYKEWKQSIQASCDGWCFFSYSCKKKRELCKKDQEYYALQNCLNQNSLTCRDDCEHAPWQ